jgi:hypothetical protein
MRVIFKIFSVLFALYILSILFVSPAKAACSEDAYGRPQHLNQPILQPPKIALVLAIVPAMIFAAVVAVNGSQRITVAQQDALPAQPTPQNQLQDKPHPR